MVFILQHVPAKDPTLPVPMGPQQQDDAGSSAFVPSPACGCSLGCHRACEGRPQLPAPYLLFLFLIVGEATGNCRLLFASGCWGGKDPSGFP